MWKKIWNPSNRKVLCLNIVAALMLTVFLEFMERKTWAELLLFMEDRTFVFLYNVLIIFVTLSLVFLVKKKYFVFGVISAFWALIGLINGVILNSRKTPFTAVDLTIAKSIIPILNSYLTIWQIVGIVVLLTLGIAALVVLFLYCPSAKKAFDLKTNAVLVGLLLGFFAIATYLGVGRGLLISRFDNLIAGYQAYGVTYGFCITAIDTGIDRPIDYSQKRVSKVRSKMNKVLDELDDEEKLDVNVIFIQLESFFDLTQVKNIELSQDPLPNIHRLQKETTSGYLTVPVYGAGTINTEFEVITGMNTDYFGTGELPYRSILHERTSESMAYWMKDKGYVATVLHNNNASFYDRDYVFSNLGFDYFVTSENMDIHSYNTVGWAKDEVLEKYIFNTMHQTEQKDLIYSISVQGHGDYPTEPLKRPNILVKGPDWSEKYTNQITYYANEIADMDAFIGKLIDRLSIYQEKTMLVFYGDHLPGLGFENEDLESGSKYKVPYCIWDNFGYNQRNRKKESEDLHAYQLAAKVFGQLGIHNGVMNAYHQTMQDSKHYKKNLKMLQYDLLYGSDFIRKGKGKLLPSNLKYCLDNVRVRKIKESDTGFIIMGANFTNYSRVFVNGIALPTQKLSDFALRIPPDSIEEGDELLVRQVSKTNENIYFNESLPYAVHEDSIVDIRTGTSD